MMQSITSLVAALVFLSMASGWASWAPAAELAVRTVPSRLIPVPETVSPALQQIIGQLAHETPKVPQTVADWNALVEASRTHSEQLAELLRNKLGVAISRQVTGGVPCYLVTPRVLTPRNRSRLLIGTGESVLLEAVEMAGLTGLKVIGIDYRMPPVHPFPAAIDDVMAVWKEVLRTAKPAHTAVFGTAFGGNLTLLLVQRARKEGLPLPAAIMVGTPWSDLSKTGDSYYTNAGLDSFTYEGLAEAAMKLYANGRDLRDPLLSPIYGDFSGFPPTFLVSGTRDLLLSNTVRVQRKLLQAGVPAQLEVEEGQSHGQYLYAATVDAPEALELYSHLGHFFDEHLGH